MKIALVDPFFFGADYDFSLLAALRKLGHDVSLYGTNHKQRTSGNFDFVPFFYNEGKFCKFFAKGKFKLLVKGIVHLKDMCNFVKIAKNYDVVHFQWLPLPIVDLYFIRKIRKHTKVIFTMHDLLPFNGGASSSIQLLRWKDIFKIFDAYIVHTAHAKQTVIKNYPHLANIIHVVAHPIILFPTAGINYKHAADISKDNINILMLGNIRKYKGIDFLIRALALLNQENLKKIQVVIAGNPSIDTDELYSLAQKWGVEKHILWDLRFIPREEVPDLMAAIDIMIFPYRAIEASGIFTLAISYHKAIIASNLGNFKEFIISGNNGFLVDIGSVEQIANCLNKLIEEPTLLQKFKDEAGRLTKLLPTWDECAEITAQVYQRTELQKNH